MSGSRVFWRMIKPDLGQELHLILEVEGRTEEETKYLSGELWSLAAGYLSEVSLNEAEVRFLNPELICERILKRFNEYLVSWAEKNSLQDWHLLSIFLGVMNPNAFYFAKIGEVRALMLRNKKIIGVDENLNVPRSPSFSPPFPEIAGGKIQGGDRILLASSEFLRVIAIERIPSLLDLQTFEVALSNIQRSLQGSIDQSKGLAFILGEVTLKEETAEYFSEEETNNGFSFSRVKNISFWEFNPLKETIVPSVEKQEGFMPVKETAEAFKEKVASPILKLPMRFLGYLSSFFEKLSLARRIILSAVFLILVFLAGYWHYSLSQKSADSERLNRVFADKSYDYEKIFAAVDRLKGESESALIYKDEEKAKKSLFEATELLAKITDSGDYGIKALKIKKEIEEKMSSLEKDDIFVETTVLWQASAGENLKGLALSGTESLLALTENKLYQISKKEKTEGGKIEGDFALGGTPGFLLRAKIDTLLFSGEERNFWIFDPAKKQLSSKKDVKEESFKRSLPAGSFEDYLYFWNSENRQIKQYTYQNGEAIFYRDWVKEDLAPILGDSKVVDLAVDGNIFLISDKGKIWRLSGGKKTDWNSETPARPLISENLRMYTEGTFSYLYVLDASKQRIAVFEKETGKLKGQIKNTELAGALDFKVDESKKEIYFNKLTEVRKIVFELKKEE